LRVELAGNDEVGRLIEARDLLGTLRLAVADPGLGKDALSDDIDFFLVFFVLSRVQIELGEAPGGFVQARSTERRAIEDRTVESCDHHAERDVRAAIAITESGLHRSILLPATRS
jgi:hypothetical protein